MKPQQEDTKMSDTQRILLAMFMCTVSIVFTIIVAGKAILEALKVN